MLFNIFLSILSLSQNDTNLTTINDQILGDRGCGLGSEDIFFINSMDDINLVKDCNTVNGSLFINGDYNIDSLKELKNINYITGYLVIYDSHMLKSLKGLQNIKNIYALNPYLLDYGVTIKYNNNDEDNTTGLCFADTVNWESLTGRNIIVSNNRDDCPNCHSECMGCFGPGRLLCQECVNYRSGIACVDSCPQGTTLSDETCIEYVPTENILMDFNRLNQNEYQLNLTWTEPNQPNGFILEYIILRNEIEIYRSFYDNDGYYSNDYLITNFIDTLPFLETNYSYQIAYSNSEGSKESGQQHFFMSNRIPLDITPFRLRGVQNTSVFFQWFYNHSSLEPTFEFNINGSQFIEIPKQEIDVTVRSWNSSYIYLLQDLHPYTRYNLNIRARYSNGNIGDITPGTFETKVGYPPQPEIPFIENNILYWNITSPINGPILFYVIWMNDTEIYSGNYVIEGVDLNNIFEDGNYYDFRVTAYTAWNIFSTSEYSETYKYFIPTTTLTPTIFPTLPVDDLQPWEEGLIIAAIIIICLISLIIIFLGIRKYLNMDDGSNRTSDSSIYNNNYGDNSLRNSKNVKNNNVMVDEVEIGRSIPNPAYLPPTSRQGAIKNTYYGELESFLNNRDEEEIVTGFNDIGETNSVEYLCIMDTETPNPIRPRPKTRRRSTINKEDIPKPPINTLKTDELNNNLKTDKNYQNTAKRKMSLLDELKLKIPEMAPKNMMLD